jgi:hypothetical protein
LQHIGRGASMSTLAQGTGHAKRADKGGRHQSNLACPCPPVVPNANICPLGVPIFARLACQFSPTSDKCALLYTFYKSNALFIFYGVK